MKMRILTTMVAFTIVTGCQSQSRPDVVESRTIEVTLEIDFQGRAENFTAVHKVPQNVTVFGLLEVAQSASKDFKFDFLGSGETAFILSFNDVANEKGEGSNWIYTVNGKLSNQGCGSTNVNDGDLVVWTFADSYNPAE